ncbi:TonB-dependent receptor plug domain-containing protein [Sphingomonas sp. ac-8]|uniref:TonB-dependent receptor plug domain-containing protein n=1 Tax=Sphingomonas sp. ac-8 TaxID=3242977 RepID=UPI003A80EC7A
MDFTTASRIALATALFTTIASGAHAQDAGGDDIVVVGQSLEETLPQELSRYGSDLETVTAEQVRDRGSVDVATALQAVPGLYVMPGSGPFSYVDVALQGSRTQDVLWTVDGIRINNRLYGGTSPNDTLPASMIERVEVLKGGESLFYGTQAAAGVINVVTRGFTDAFDGEVAGAVDSFGGTAIDGYARGSIGAHRFVAYASRNESEGYRPYSVMQPSATDRRRGYRLWSVGGKYQIDVAADLRLNLQYQHTDAKLDNLSPARTNRSRNDRNEEIASARLDYTGSDAVQFFLKGYFHDWKTAYVQIRNPVPAGPPITVYPEGTFWGYQDYGGSAVVKLHPHRGLEYLVGYDFQNFNGRDDVLLIGKTSEQVHAGILQLRTTDELSERARLSAGLRHNETAGTKKTIWNVSGRAELTDTLYVEGTGGTSFVLPDASSLYGIDPCCEVGNPNLKAEQSFGFNLTAGGSVALGVATVAWKAGYFHRDVTDLIDATYDDPAFPNGTYVNVDDKVRVRGAEAQLDAALGRDWHVNASYTYSRVRNEGATTQRDRSPAQFAKGAIVYAPVERRFGANVAVSWIGDVYSSPSGFARQNYGNYALVDLGAHVFLDAARRNRFGINVENLTGEDYATRGFGSAAADDGGRFLYFTRGVPRTLRVRYSLGF